MTSIILEFCFPFLPLLAFWYGDKPFIWLAIKMGWFQ